MGGYGKGGYGGGGYGGGGYGGGGYGGGGYGGGGYGGGMGHMDMGHGWKRQISKIDENFNFLVCKKCFVCKYFNYELLAICLIIFCLM